MTTTQRHILITDHEYELPYSKGLMARALIATGMPAVRAYELARRIDEDLQDRADVALVHREALVVVVQLRPEALELLGAAKELDWPLNSPLFGNMNILPWLWLIDVLALQNQYERLLC